MRISWLSNAPWARTGYGNQTQLFVPRLQKAGHEMQITAFYGLEGGILNWNGIPVYPRAIHPYGADIMSAHALTHQADILISLIDAWVFEASMFAPGVRWVPWFPVDHETVPRRVLDRVMAGFARIVYSRHAESKMKESGLDCYYVPHGVDLEVYKPVPNRAEVIEKLTFPKDKFVVGMVAANKGMPSRKAFQQNLAAFKMLKDNHSDVFMYLHTVSGETNLGMDIPPFLEHLGLKYGFIGSCDPNEVDVLFPDQYQLLIGINDSYMNAVYNAMDVHLLVSSGEGFGIPLIEAQAASTPVIVGDWTSMSELCFSGWKVPKNASERVWTQMNTYQYLPHVGAIYDCLEAAYRMRGNQEYRDRAVKGVARYAVDKIVEKYWLPTLKDIEERVLAWGNPSATDGKQWLGVGLYNPDGSIDTPEKTTGDAMRVYRDGRKEIIPGAFKNPLGLKFTQPDGLEWLLMREVERDYDLDNLHLGKDSLVIDLGAHVGVVSMSLAKKYGCKVWAFEPEPMNYQRLKDNVVANDLGILIDTFNLAVTKDARDVTIGGGGFNSGGHSIYSPAGSTVQSMTLGEIVRMEYVRTMRIDLLKIDIEGAEHELFEEGVDLLGLLGNVSAIRGEFHGKEAPGLLARIKKFVPNTKITLQGVSG